MKEQKLQETWYGDREPGLLLSALERVYGSVSARRRSGATPAPDLVGRPIIVIGNITVGGTGKTPLVIRLLELLREAGLTPAVISRGYGRRERGPVRVGAHTTPAEGGDEPVLIARRCGVEVYVDANREDAARVAFADGADIVLADDGLQRASLPRIQEFCVVDARRGFGNGRLLPAGPLREPLERLERVDWLVRNGPEPLPELNVPLRHPMVSMGLEPAGFYRLRDGRRLDPGDWPSAWKDGVTAVAGMGNPDRFFATLKHLGVPVNREVPFPDHHAFARQDFDGVNGPILMTEKDAVKCVELDLPEAWALRVGATLPADWAADWVASVQDIIKEKDLSK